MGLKEALTRMEITDRQGEYLPFSIEYVRTGGFRPGSLGFRKRVRKLGRSWTKVFLESSRPMGLSKGVKEKSTSKFKGNNKKDRTVPMQDLDTGDFFKVKIWGIRSFNGHRVMMPTYLRSEKRFVYPEWIDDRFV